MQTTLFSYKTSEQLRHLTETTWSEAGWFIYTRNTWNNNASAAHTRRWHGQTYIMPNSQKSCLVEKDMFWSMPHTYAYLNTNLVHHGFLDHSHRCVNTGKTNFTLCHDRWKKNDTLIRISYRFLLKVLQCFVHSSFSVKWIHRLVHQLPHSPISSQVRCQRLFH